MPFGAVRKLRFSGFGTADRARIHLRNQAHAKAVTAARGEPGAPRDLTVATLSARRTPRFALTGFTVGALERNQIAQVARDRRDSPGR